MPGKLVAAAVVLLLFVCGVTGAQASLPGKNGTILLDSGPPQYGLSVLSPGQKNPREIGTGIDSSTMTPSGRLAFSEGNFIFTSWLSDPNRRTQIPGAGVYGLSPVFLPNGAGLVYLAVGDFSDATRVYATNLSGSRQRQIQSFDELVRRLDVSPDGTMLAAALYGSTYAGIILIDRATGEVRPLGGAELGNAPSFSPDGRKVAFSRDDSNGISQIYVTDVSDSTPRPLTSGQYDSTVPVFSPDGTKVVFSRRTDQGTSIRTVTMSGRETVLVKPSRRDYLPSTWVPSDPFLVRQSKRKSTLVKIRTFGPGNLELSGPRIRTKLVRFNRGEWKQIRIKLTSRAKSILRRNGSLTTTLTVTLAPDGATRRTRRTSITFN